MGLLTFIQEWQSLFRFWKVPVKERPLVFYAEDSGSWRYFEPVISKLINRFNKKIYYITSSHADPILQKSDKNMTSFCIGFGSARTAFFMSLEASSMVMTMTDLDTYHIKRSRHPVNYMYLFHAMISTHMVYRPGAFDNYDEIFCVGPHHMEEIRAAEEVYHLKKKTLIKGGYVLLDSILESKQIEAKTSHNKLKRILIAPSWGKQGLLESCGFELVKILLGAGHQVTVRPHTMTIRRSPKILQLLQGSFGSDANFHLDVELTSQGTVSESDIMISDWSGAALEYALGKEKPVIFIDVPKKVNNEKYQDIPFVPIEVQLRSEIGEIVPLDQLLKVPTIVERLCADPDAWQARMRAAREKWIYNVGDSANVIAEHIARSLRPRTVK